MEDRSIMCVGPRSDPDAFRLLTPLGSDSDGDAWLATYDDPHGQEQVAAVKVCPSVDDPDVEASWDIYAQMLIRLRHPNVVRVRDAFTGTARHAPGHARGPHDFRYVVMDYVPGPTVARWLVDVPQTQFAARREVMRAIAGGLDKLHAGYGVGGRAAHGEVTPANVIVCADGRPVLVDIGPPQVRSVDPEAGSPQFAAAVAPELRAPHSMPTVAGDAYAVGAAAVHVFTGAPAPVDAAGSIDVADASTRLRTHRAMRWHPLLRRFILALLAEDPADRPESLRRLF